MCPAAAGAARTCHNERCPLLAAGLAADGVLPLGDAIHCGIPHQGGNLGSIQPLEKAEVQDLRRTEWPAEGEGTA